MAPKLVGFAIGVTVATALVLVIFRFAARLMSGAKRSSRGVGALTWALLFLTSGRMPPPPPATQIEVDVAGKKDREASRDIGDL